MADDHGLRVHLDGARVMNAAVALGVPTSRVVRDVDTVSMCFSKVGYVTFSDSRLF